MTKTHDGSSFFAPKTDGSVSISFANRTEFELTELDREYARWVATNAFGATQSGLSASDAAKVAKATGKGVEDKYRNASASVLNSVVAITKLPRKRVLPFLKQAASTGEEVAVDGGYGLVFGPKGAHLKNYNA